MKTITFYSYKGGVGRTLALSNIAKRLSEFGKKVCIIDFDLEAPGLHHKFNKNIKQNELNLGLVDYIYEYYNNNNVPHNIKDYVTKINFSEGGNMKDIDLIHAGNTNTKEYWRRLSSINWADMFYEEHSNGVAFFIDLKEKIRKQLKPDFILIDSRTGITDISGVTMSILADEVVLLAAYNEENINGIKQIISSLAIPENTFINGTPKIHFVLSRIPYFSDPKEKHKEQKAKNYAYRIINNHLKIEGINNFKLDKIMVIHSDRELELEEKFKIGYDHDRLDKDLTNTPIAIDYLELFEELTQSSLSPKEKDKFNKLRRAELLIEQAKNTDSNISKRKLLDSAIKLNTKSSEAYQELSILHFNLENYEEALKNINKAIELVPNSMDYLYLKGIIYFSKSKTSKEAEKIFSEILKTKKDYLGALHQLARIYSAKNNNDKALEYQKLIVKYYPDYDGGYNSVGDTLRKMERYKEALDYVYKALELNPQSIYATATLAEINAHLKNDREFYKNLELAFSFGMKSDTFQKVLQEEKIYKKYFKNDKFKNLLNKYNMNIDFSTL